MDIVFMIGFRLFLVYLYFVVILSAIHHGIETQYDSIDSMTAQANETHKILRDKTNYNCGRWADVRG